LGVNLSRLLLVRHGETKLNSAQRYWGHTDVELSLAGLKQAERLRDYLQAERIDAIYSSDLKRACLTAEVIASRHKLGVIICPELKEIDFGKIEGLTFAEVNHLYPEVSRLWVKRSAMLKYPGGESVSHFRQRILSFIDSYLKGHLQEETILIVAHSGVLRTIICHQMNLDFSNMGKIRLDLASLSILEVYPNTAVLSRLNDISHLEGKV